jgi:hypothetical protein
LRINSDLLISDWTASGMIIMLGLAKRIAANVREIASIRGPLNDDELQDFISNYSQSFILKTPLL